MKIGIFLFDGVDVLDAGGPYEVFLTANRLLERAGEAAPFDVMTISPDGAAVTAYGGLGLLPHASAADCGPLDVVVVPGTIDLAGALENVELIETVRRLAVDSDIKTSVCTGAFLLDAAGLLQDGPWTTHWEDIDALAETAPATGAQRGVRWADAGDVVTSGGLTAGIDMALHMVDRLVSLELAEQTARQLDHPWTPDPSV